MLTRFKVDTGWVEAITGMALVGVGIGLAVPVINLAVQNAFSRRYLGIATSSSQFFRSIGATLGVAIFGTLVVTGIQDNIDRTLPVAVTDAATPRLIEQLHEPDVILSTHGRASLEEGFLAARRRRPVAIRFNLAAIETVPHRRRDGRVLHRLPRRRARFRAFGPGARAPASRRAEEDLHSDRAPAARMTLLRSS